MDADGRLNLSPDGEFQPFAVDLIYVFRTFTKSYVRNLGTKNEMILCKMAFVNVENYIFTISANQNLYVIFTTILYGIGVVYSRKTI